MIDRKWAFLKGKVLFFLPAGTWEASMAIHPWDLDCIAEQIEMDPEVNYQKPGRRKNV